MLDFWSRDKKSSPTGIFVEVSGGQFVGVTPDGALVFGDESGNEVEVSPEVGFVLVNALQVQAVNYGLQDLNDELHRSLGVIGRQISILSDWLECVHRALQEGR